MTTQPSSAGRDTATNHRPNCTGANVYTRVNGMGTTWFHCHGCNGYWRHAPADVVPTVAPRGVPGSYRCRDHHEQPVTWKGTGCPLCPSRNNHKARATDDDDDATPSRRSR